MTTGNVNVPQFERFPPGDIQTARSPVVTPRDRQSVQPVSILRGSKFNAGLVLISPRDHHPIQTVRLTQLTEVRSFAEEPKLEETESDIDVELESSPLFDWSPHKAVTGWLLLVIGCLLMMCSGNAHYCENFANRQVDVYQSLDYLVLPVWPPTISTMCSDFSMPSGRFFFVFMLLGGILVLFSNVLVISFAQDRMGRRARRDLVTAICLGTLVVGTCPISQTNIHTGESLSTMWNETNPVLACVQVSAYMHLIGAGFAFVSMPVVELVVGMGVLRSDRIRSPIKIALGMIGISIFLSFQYFNMAANSVTGTHLDKRYEKDSHNIKSFWLEYICAQWSIMLLALRICSVNFADSDDNRVEDHGFRGPSLLPVVLENDSDEDNSNPVGQRSCDADTWYTATTPVAANASWDAGWSTQSAQSEPNQRGVSFQGNYQIRVSAFDTSEGVLLSPGWFGQKMMLLFQLASIVLSCAQKAIFSFSQDNYCCACDEFGFPCVPLFTGDNSSRAIVYQLCTSK